MGCGLLELIPGTETPVLEWAVDEAGVVTSTIEWGKTRIVCKMRERERERERETHSGDWCRVPIQKNSVLQS